MPNWPLYDPGATERNWSAFSPRGKLHGNYCGWGHTSPMSTRPADEIDNVCRTHDYSVSDESGNDAAERARADWLAIERFKALRNNPQMPRRGRELLESMEAGLSNGRFPIPGEASAVPAEPPPWRAPIDDVLPRGAEQDAQINREPAWVSPDDELEYMTRAECAAWEEFADADCGQEHERRACRCRS